MVISTTTTTTSPSTVVEATASSLSKKEEECPKQQQQQKLKQIPRRRRKVMMQVPVELEDFMALEDPHPYGVLPGGNQLFNDDADNTGTKKNKNNVSCLSESLWQDVLSFCDSGTLSRMVQVSRYFYVAGHQPELWRDLVLRHSVTLTPTEHNPPSSWKDVYVSLFYNNNHPQNNNNKKHVPMNLSGKVYSDFLYRNHLCRSFAIPSAWLEDDGLTSNTSRPVPSVDYASMTANQFFDGYESKNMPVLVRGAASTTRAHQHWKDPNYLLKTQTSDTAFRATSGAAPLPADFTLPAYLQYCQEFSSHEESPLYLFDRNAFLDPDHPWSKDFFDEFYQNCPYWNVHNHRDHGHDLLQHLGSNEKRPDHTWIIMGPKRSGSVFHLDPNATHAWNVSLKGRKRWIFYPPGITPPGVHPSSDGDEVALPLSVGEWIVQFWQEHSENLKSSNNKPPHERPMECTAHPGDAIFVPHGWWHMVVNLDEGYNLAMTHNYVSPSNLGNVLKFFHEKQDQISGCRDRKETIKPEHLHDAFVDALRREAPQFLDAALEQTGWTCRAFEAMTTETTTRKKNRLTKTNHKTKKRRLETTDSNDEDGTSTAESTNKSVMAKANTSTPFSFSFL
jgi:hypothetical protein